MRKILILLLAFVAFTGESRALTGAFEKDGYDYGLTDEKYSVSNIASINNNLTDNYTLVSCDDALNLLDDFTYSADYFICDNGVIDRVTKTKCSVVDVDEKAYVSCNGSLLSEREFRALVYRPIPPDTSNDTQDEGDYLGLLPQEGQYYCLKDLNGDGDYQQNELKECENTDNNQLICPIQKTECNPICPSPGQYNASRDRCEAGADLGSGVCRYKTTASGGVYSVDYCDGVWYGITDVYGNGNRLDFYDRNKYVNSIIVDGCQFYGHVHYFTCGGDGCSNVAWGLSGVYGNGNGLDFYGGDCGKYVGKITVENCYFTGGKRTGGLDITQVKIEGSQIKFYRGEYGNDLIASYQVCLECPFDKGYRLDGNVCVRQPDRKCPYGDQYACLIQNGKYYCSPNGCYQWNGNDSHIVDEDTQQGANDKTNDGETDDKGNCLGNLYIFNGNDLRCRTPGIQTGLSNCCKKTTTWFGLGQCNKDEKILAKLRSWGKRDGQCHYVGKYCSKKIKLGPSKVCVQHKKTFCCFHSVLGRIIQEQGRKQLGISWGEAKSPNCRGFTPEEFQRIDFSKIDFSEWYGDLKKRVKDNVDVFKKTIPDKVNSYYQNLQKYEQ